MGCDWKTKKEKKCGPSESARIEDGKNDYFWCLFIISFWCVWMKWGQRHKFFYHLFRFRFGVRYFIYTAVAIQIQERISHSLRNTRVFRRKQSKWLLSIIFRIGERNSRLVTISHFTFWISHSFVGVSFFLEFAFFPSF